MGKVSKEKRIVAFALLAYFILLLVWTLNIKFNNCPDEAMRFDIVNFIFKNHKLPTLFDKSIINERYGFSYASQPNLPYIIMAFFVWIAHFFVGASKLYLIARFVNVGFGVVFLFILIRLSKALFNKNNLRLLFVSLVALWPMACYVFTYVNCDGFALMSNALLTWGIVEGIRNKWRLKDCIKIVLGSIFIMLSYVNGISYMIAAVIVFIASYCMIYKDYKEMAKKGIAMSVITLIGGGWYYVRNLILYHSLLGGNITSKMSEKYAISSMTSAERAARAKEEVLNISGVLKWIGNNVKYYLGIFKYGGGKFHTVIYLVAIAIIVITVVVAIIFFFKKRRKIHIYSKITYAFFVIGAITTILLAFYYCAFQDNTPSPRYLIPIGITVSFFMTYGCKEISKKINKKYNSVIYYFLPISLLVINIYAALFIV